MITLTNGVQVPENAVQLRTTAPMDGYYVTQPLRLVQYDETLPVAAVQLTYQNQPYTPPTGAELNVRMGKPDGTTVYNPCLGVDANGVVYFVFTQQMTIVAGTGTLTVEITDSGVKNSAPIIAEIRPNPVPEGSIESADEFLTLQEILAEAEKWGQIVQTNASNIQQVVDNLEDIQNAAENAQAAAASAAAAQKAAQEALGFRKFYSAVVPDANGNLDPSRPMTVGPAASVEIESAGDRIQSVTALGFTQQAGTGDPSPSNVRAITNGGLKLVEVAFTGSESWRLQSGAYLASGFTAGLANGVGYASPVKFQYGYGGQGIFVDGTGTACLGSGAVTALGYTDVSQWKADLQAAYNAGMPYKMWYQPADESQATGLYAPIILQGGEYRATCLPLTAPLCEGDSVVSWVKSGCDKVVTFDGSSDENWAVTESSNNVQYISVPLDYSIRSGFKTVLAYCNRLAKVTPSSADANPTSLDTYSVFARFLGDLVIKINIGADSAEAAKQELAANPITIWLKSPNYTEDDDIAVSLETHQQAVLVLDGTEKSHIYDRFFYLDGISGPESQSRTSGICSHYQYTTYGSRAIGVALDGQSIIYSPDGDYVIDEEGLTKWKADLAAQYAAGTPVTIVYKLAAHITYAHEAVALEAATGEQLTYTVTGQSGGQVSVALKPFQDGGHAKTADNAQQLDGLTLLAIKETLTPVGYIFSWAPVNGGPDLSTPAKVAAYFGFGTWQAYGTGQVLVGVDSGQTEFATVGKTGGKKTHTLTTQELPKFTPNPVGGGSWLCIAGASGAITQGLAQPGTAWAGENVGPIGGQTIGGNQPHNNLQPYITVYRWQRIA